MQAAYTRLAGTSSHPATSMAPRRCPVTMTPCARQACQGVRGHESERCLSHRGIWKAPQVDCNTQSQKSSPGNWSNNKYAFVSSSTKKPDMPWTDPYHKWMSNLLTSGHLPQKITVLHILTPWGRKKKKKIKYKQPYLQRWWDKCQENCLEDWG